jgi:hypothetical protein
MRHKLVLWFLLFLAGFLIGFILQYSRLRQVHQELSASTTQLGSCQSSQQLSQLRDTATMMYLEVVQKNYGKAAEYSKEFFDQAQQIQQIASSTDDPGLRTCFVTRWRPEIRSRRTWRREMPPPFRQYSRSYLSLSRRRSTDMHT